MYWDLFCRVIDNHGDAGVACRLARDLAGRGHAVRMWIDDPSPLAWMAPDGLASVEVQHWTPGQAAVTPGEVVVELFGCEPPASFVQAMAASPAPPVWINLEYLSAEPYVERSHGLPSPLQSGLGRGLTRWFFYPGFTPRTGGLLREPGLATERAAFSRMTWLSQQGIDRRPGERLVSLFGYASAPLPGLLERLADSPTLLLVAAGAAQEALAHLPLPPGVRTHALPWLSQPDFDRLLWASDLNFVRGEDSLVRAIWAGAPFVWQIYPQHDGAHAAKLDAFLNRLAVAHTGADAETRAGVAAWFRGWNGLADLPTAWPDLGRWRAACMALREPLAAEPDLTTQLHAFALRATRALPKAGAGG
jgi:uncharacterized repeat protein (TIGR03837 family)